MKSKVGYSIGEPNKTEPWFDDFGDTDELRKSITTEECKRTMKSELDKLQEDVHNTHKAYFNATHGTLDEAKMHQIFKNAANLRNKQIDKMQKAGISCETGLPYKEYVFGDVLDNATNSQVGGNHYKNQGVQPIEATFANFGYEGIRASIYTKVNKYLTRDKGTHRQDITKAIHVLQMQLEFYDKYKEDNSL